MTGHTYADTVGDFGGHDCCWEPAAARFVVLQVLLVTFLTCSFASQPVRAIHVVRDFFLEYAENLWIIVLRGKKVYNEADQA